MSFSLLDLEKNCTCACMNFTHLTWLMLLHCLVKVQTTKMHVNTNSAFSMNYEIAIKWTKLHWQFLMNHIIQMNSSFTACVQSVRHQHAHMISDGRATGQSQPRWRSAKINPSLHQAFCRSQMSQVFLSYTQCCITPQILSSTGPFQ